MRDLVKIIEKSQTLVDAFSQLKDFEVVLEDFTNRENYFLVEARDEFMVVELRQPREKEEKGYILGGQRLIPYSSHIGYCFTNQAKI